VHFEIAAGDVDRLKSFYSTVFGWTYEKWGDGEHAYWLIKTGQGPGIDGGFMRRREPGGLTVNTIDVASVDESVKTAVANGAALAVPEIPIPGVGWLAYCKDPEGTLFGMMQMDPNAK
jgi:predicted enzyme related to lactoylglutathione lyase